MPRTDIRTVLFDLDGTLADTAPDLASALNQVLRNNNCDALPYDQIRPVVSHGGIALIKLGFAIEPDHPEFEPLRMELLDVYRNNIAAETSLFPGMADLLEYIEHNGCNWGIVTNKPGWLTEPLMEALQLKQRASCIVSGDTLAQRKPDPAPLLHACNLSGSKANECVYIGDAERDIQAGRDAGMQTLLAGFGYIAAEDQPAQWGADAIMDSPADIIAWLKEQ